MAGAPPQVPSFVREPEHLMDFVDTAAIGLHWVGPDGTILWANRADYEPLGYTAEEYIGHNIQEFHADDASIQDILERLAAGQRIHDYPARLRCKDGSVRSVEITSSVLFKGSKFVHTRCYTRDVTERQRMQEARDRFVAVLGHDLRNPLTSITVGLQMIAKAGLPEPQAEILDRTQRSVQRVNKLVEDLIDFAKTMGGQMPLERQQVDLGRLCARLVAETQTAHGVELPFEQEGDLRGSWDPDRLEQALSNLFVNAAVHGRPPHRVRAVGHGDAVHVEVRNGGELTGRDARDVFEPFGHTTSSTGLGLGLFIVRQIVEAHGGDAEVDIGHGETAFQIRLPREAA